MILGCKNVIAQNSENEIKKEQSLNNLFKFLGILLFLVVLKTGVSQNINTTSIKRSSPNEVITKDSSLQFIVTFDERALNVDTSDFATIGSVSANTAIQSVTKVSDDKFLVDVFTNSSVSGNIGLGIKGINTPGTNNILNDNIVIDQSCLNDLQITSSKEVGQSFIAGQSGKLYYVTIQNKFSHNYSGTGTMQLRSGSGLSGTVLATENVTMTSSLGEKTYWFTNPAQVTSGQTYTIHFKFTNGSGNFQMSAQTGNNYPNGILYQPAAFPTADLYFKTHIGTGPVKPLSTTAPLTNEEYQFIYFPEPIVKSIERKNPLSSTALATNVVFEVKFDSSVVEVSPEDFSLNSTVNGTIDSVLALSETNYQVYVSNLDNTNGTLGLNIKGVGGTAGTNNILSKKYGDSLTVNINNENDYLNQPKIGQTFIAKTSTELRRITIFPKSGIHSFNGTATMRIVSGDDLLHGASNILTTTITLSNNTSSEGQSFVISPAIPLTKGNTYSVVFENFNGVGGHALQSSTNGGFSDGHVIFTGYNTPSHGNFDLKIKIWEKGYGFGSPLSPNAPLTNETYSIIPVLTCNVTVNSDVSCSGGADGGLTVNSSGNPGPFTYLWSNGATTQSITGLSEGVYSVTVTSTNGGTQTASNSGLVGVASDNTAPIITVCASTPSNITANNSCTGTTPDLTGSVTATDNCTTSPTITQSPSAGATLGLGTTTITLIATDGSGNTATCTVNQTVVDNTAPTITVCASTPSNITANGSCQGTAPNLTGSVTATDNCTGSPTITQSPSAGATLGLGTTTITLTATDGSGNTATCTVNQTVVDNTAPTITVCASTPSNITANGSCQGTAPDLTGSVTATDNCTGSPTITQSPSSGATLGLGTTTITLTATDGSGNTATCTVNQTVIDNTAPTITVCPSTPSNITANGSCQGTAPDLTGSVTATDNCTGNPTITQSPSSGATLGLGTTTITLTATDGSGNTATCTVNQTVIDATAPTITVCASTPSNITANEIGRASCRERVYAPV